jgi:hypothetical protein
MQRMEQQVQRAVDAAKNKPKSKQLVIEGSLGKISFSNAKLQSPCSTSKGPKAALSILAMLHEIGEPMRQVSVVVIGRQF